MIHSIDQQDYIYIKFFILIMLARRTSFIFSACKEKPRLLDYFTKKYVANLDNIRGQYSLPYPFRCNHQAEQFGLHHFLPQKSDFPSQRVLEGLNVNLCRRSQQA